MHLKVKDVPPVDTWVCPVCGHIVPDCCMEIMTRNHDCPVCQKADMLNFNPVVESHDV